MRVERPEKNIHESKPRPRASFGNYIVAMEPETGLVILAMIVIMAVMFPEWRLLLIIAFCVAFLYFGGIFSGGRLGEMGEEKEEEEEKPEPRMDRSNIF